MTHRFRPRPPAPPGVDQELWETLGQDPTEGRQLLRLGTLIHRLLRESEPPPADPLFRSRLRANLMAQARLQHRQPRRRPVGLALGATMGVAGVAMLAVVLVTVVVLPRTDRTVTVRASVAGRHQVPVTQAIQLRFNQPMVEPAVDHGLNVEPALSFRTVWPDNQTLLIAPRHQLVPNVSYVVSIARTAARSQNDGYPVSKIVIPFGTLSAAVSPSGLPPSVVSTSTVAVSGGPASLTYAQDGALVVLAQGGLEVGGVPAPTPSASLSPSPSPSSSPSLSLGNGGSDATGDVYSLNSPVQLIAPGAVNMAVSPDSQNLALWTPLPQGGYALEVAPTSGGGAPLSLASSQDADPTAAWIDSGELLYSSGSDLYQVSLAGAISQVDPTVQLALSGAFTLSPSGSALFTVSGNGPTVYDLATGGSVPLSGISGQPVWSESGDQMAFVSAQGGRSVLELADTFGDGVKLLLTAPSGETLRQPAFDPTGRFLAYQLQSPGQGAELGAVDIESGHSTVLSTDQGLSDPVWSPYGTMLTALQAVSGANRHQVVDFQLSATGSLLQSDQAGDLAVEAATSLAELQLADAPAQQKQAVALLAPGVDVPSSVLFPGHFDRFYTVSSTPLASSPGDYLVELELVRDATTSSPPQYLDEEVTLEAGSATPSVESITDSLLTTVPSGPLIVASSAAPTASGGMEFSVQFDADLEPATVGPASITLTDAGVEVSGVQCSYSAALRTVTVTAPQLAPGTLLLTIGAPLADVDHRVMAAPFQLSVPDPTGPGST